MIKTLIRKLFLVREIRKDNILYFRRWRLLSTPWFGIYIHHVNKSDIDLDPHNHPWDFLTIGIKGILREYDKYGNLTPEIRFGSWKWLRTWEFHRNIVFESFWGLVITGRRRNSTWGYWTSKGWVDHKEYWKDSDRIGEGEL